MAQANTIKFGTQALLIGDGGSPEAFAAPCGITTLNKVTNVDAQTIAIPDCDDPDLAVWLGVDEISRQMVLSGSGTVATQSLPLWDAWDRNGGYKNVRWFRNLTAGNGGGYYQGSALLTQWEENAEARRRYTFNFAVTFDGRPTWTAAS